MSSLCFIKLKQLMVKKHLRFYYKDNYVLTIDLLELNSVDGRVGTGKTVYTSQACATWGGCVPNGNYCTPCVPPTVQTGSGLTGDYSPSTSN